jgi:D-alanyl-D-alanine carboxypeptidase
VFDRRLPSFVFIAIAVLGLSAIAASPASAGSSATQRADRALDQQLKRLVSMRGGPPGAIAVVQRGDQRRTFNRGVADLSNRRRIDIGDRWRIASVAKAFSGAVALRLVATGRMSLSDTIGQRLPWLPAAWHPVTLAQLLQHTAGTPEYITTDGFREDITREPLAPVTPRDVISWVADKPLDFPPGSRYHYSDTDNIVIGLMVEAATGMSYELAMSQTVLDPLKLRRTSMPSGYRMPAPFVRGYDLEGRRYEDVSEVLSPTGAWASGGIVSSPLDLVNFIRAYAGGRLFDGATRRAQLQFIPGRSFPSGPGTTEAGLGIFRYRTRCGTVYGHTGNYPGYTAFVAGTADGRRAATILVNEQLSDQAGPPAAFRALHRAFELATCAALAR